MKHIFLLLALSAVVASCSHKAEHVEKAFYFWKNNEYSFSESERNLLESTGVKKMYVKFFEVEKNEVMGNIPVAKTELHMYNNFGDFNLVPTVYIRNEVFKDCTKQSLDLLADNVNFLINKYRTDYKFKNIQKVDEYQMDCDWTISTKDNYFYFLKRLKELSQKKISCTLRLYPYKYPDKMGVPPVDSVMLMCYNLIKPLEDHERNSILDNKEFSAYLDTDEKYPLHIDIALPVYSWVQVYQNNHFQKLLYTDTKSIKAILKPEKDFWYQVQNDTVINDFYLREGDKIKIEAIGSEQLKEAIDIIKKRVKLDKSITVSLFHLDAEQLKSYSNEEITGFYSRFTE
ncbi:hypothetical protein [Flavobacterium sp. AG291]|uniref:hypothetical protein n=1 Tax=Flavobacterium sp. AG291 TaxID=2184000 RepID=UPI000E0BE4B2|nr:hypothetical protein [Flavobacterium sp. AG291]RDI05589.1 hypothetical protein DEU42_11612 [Flavobacterium sp. AG291]